MNRIKTIFALIHVPLWVLFCLLIFIQMGSSGDPGWFGTAMGFLLTCLYAFYGHFFIMTVYYRNKRKQTYFLALAGILVTGPLPFLIGHTRDLDGSNSLSNLYFMIMFLVVPVFIFLSWLTRITHDLIINTIRKEELEKQAVQAELYYLKSQINPHFLFNTLNNIHTLVYKQAPTAPEAVMRLSSLMRYMIYESNAPTVPLSREMTYLEDYISLQQLRYKKNPVVDLRIEGVTDSSHIAPLLFIHLLENAYKHSPARLEPGDIKVSIEVKEDELAFKLINPIGKNPGNKFEEIGGIGLPNVQKRLTLLYPEQHNLEIMNSGDVFEVILKIHNLHSQVYDNKTHLLYN